MTTAIVTGVLFLLGIVATAAAMERVISDAENVIDKDREEPR